MYNFAMTIEYDGTDFLGWQIQADGRTVQGEIEASLQTIFQEKIRVTAAGRTDTGVHAAGQVAHFRTASSISLEKLRHGLNGLLRPDLVIRSIREEDENFHARYSATGRQYLYRILRRPSALRWRYAWHVPYNLDMDSVKTSCTALVGDHDFTSFCQAAASLHGARCHVTDLVWQEKDDEIRLDISANRFLHHMIRAIVGTAVEIGRGRWAPEKMQQILEAKDRKVAGPNAPAHGLCLYHVTYPLKHQPAED